MVRKQFICYLRKITKIVLAKGETVSKQARNAQVSCGDAPSQQQAEVLFLKLGSAEPQYQGFRETKMRNGGRVLLAVRNLCVRV
jgi:hypothetical protein